LRFWQELKAEVFRWKFVPFKKGGKAVTATVEEYLDLVPPERPPKVHVPAPVLRTNSQVAIILERTSCYGTCPSYAVKVSTDGIVFEGRSFVASSGKHVDSVDAAQVRKLAERFIDADFYSMDDEYVAGVTDNPTYSLSVTIDGQTKRVVDYVGSRVGMPAVITELENEVDAFARTQRWLRRR
jgi:hypothetical protein